VLIVDDVIATGGTARAAGELVGKLGGVVAAYAFLLELSFPERPLAPGRRRPEPHPLLSRRTRMARRGLE
jgi:adenine phosphoribosyltransferase